MSVRPRASPDCGEREVVKGGGLEQEDVRGWRLQCLRMVETWLLRHSFPCMVRTPLLFRYLWVRGEGGQSSGVRGLKRLL